MNARAIWIIISGGIILSLAVGMRMDLGLFQAPIVAHMNWDISDFAFALALQNVLWGLSQPFVSAIGDKYGTARTVLGGSILYIAGLLWMSEPGSPVLFSLSAGVLIGLGLAGMGFPLVLGAVARAVEPKQRGAALGIASALGAAGQPVFALVIHYFNQDFGWSMSLIWLAVIVTLSLPLILVLRGKPESAPGDVASSLGQAIQQAFRHRGYLLLNCGFFVCGFQVTFIAVHLPKYITDQGVAAEWAAVALFAIGIANIIGSFLWGWMGDRFSKKYLLSFMYFVRAILILLFIFLPVTPLSIVLFSSLIGILWLGTVPLTSGLVGQIFGPKYLATLFGVVFASHQIGAFIGVYMGGLLYDLSGSFLYAWLSAAALGFIAMFFHLPINESPAARAQPAQ